MLRENVILQKKMEIRRRKSKIEEKREKKILQVIEQFFVLLRFLWTLAIIAVNWKFKKKIRSQNYNYYL